MLYLIRFIYFMTNDVAGKTVIQCYMYTLCWQVFIDMCVHAS